MLGAYIAVLNWYCIYASHKSKRNISPVPIFGALFLILGLLGFTQTRGYAWVGILADYGTLALVLAIPALALESWRTSRINLLHRFLSDSNGRRDDIRLFKRGRFTSKTEYDPPIPCNKHGALAVSLGRAGAWTDDGDGFCLMGYGEDRIMRIKQKDGMFISQEVNYPESNEFKHDRMGGLTLKKVL